MAEVYHIRYTCVNGVFANGWKAWECHLTKLDFELATNDFRIVSIELVDGKPKVEWEPKTKP